MKIFFRIENQDLGKKTGIFRGMFPWAERLKISKKSNKRLPI